MQTEEGVSKKDEVRDKGKRRKKKEKEGIKKDPEKAEEHGIHSRSRDHNLVQK